jgi:glucan 1,3-beta-glucosidase
VPQNPPTILASSNFAGIAVIDADPYGNGGANWYTNQNNFYRSVRNFVIDLRQGPSAGATAFHWQVSQGKIISAISNLLELMVCANSDVAHEHPS